MSDQRIKLDFQPGMVFFQKNHKLYFMLTEMSKTSLTFNKIHDSRGVEVKTLAELHDLLNNEKWVLSSLEECINLPHIKAKSTGSKITTQERILKELKELEAYYYSLKRHGESYNRNKLRERK